MTRLVDSDWIIDFLAGRPAARSIFTNFVGDGLATSIVSFAEIYAGLYSSQDPRKSEREFRNLLASVTVTPFTRTTARRYARIYGTLRPQGLLLPFADMAIAATALQRDWEIVTRNLRHYQRIPGLKLHTYPESSPAT